ncbi:MAG: sigma-54 dependent transcriptional regulator [Ignavibacteriaceae bacterium]|jgi:two-component system NtrC family response regulator
MKNFNLLIVDDEQGQRNIISGYLKKKGYSVYTASSGTEGIQSVKNYPIDIIISDFKMPDKTGIEVLEAVKSINPEISFVMVTAFGTVENAVKAMRLGAYDYLAKPIDLDELDLLLERIIENKNLKSENQYLKQQLEERFKISTIISQSPRMEEAISLAARVAESKATVLITGENGTGKEVLAKAIHFISPRKNNPFIAVNIPALSENLMESELFGHERGAFTGADKMKKGRFELADKGTIFLDEIGDVPMPMQVKLLRVLQEQQIERVGGTEIIPIDVRIIAATNQDLEKKIKEGTFREDLFYRLNIVAIKIPPLRERKEDILPLIEFFLLKYANENKKETFTISKEAVDQLMKYSYPGNVRELENSIERAVVLARGNTLTQNDLPLSIKGFVIEEPYLLQEGTLVEIVESLERKLITDALQKSNGNQTQAGKLLGLTERNLRYKLQKYGIKN